jgi:glutathione synthase/RimK-type ligase-like ATP-grasp enzyme
MNYDKPRLLLVDAPGGPQPDELAEALPAVGSVRVLMVRWGNDEQVAKRRKALERIGPVTTVARPDHVMEFGIALAAEHPIDGVFAFSEVVSFQAGLLAHLLGLPGNPPTAVLAVRHKNLQRQLLAEAGVPSTALRVIRTGADLAACHELRFPVILKPAAGVGSFCVVRASDQAELAERYAEAVSRFLSHPITNGADPTFLVEEEIAGKCWHDDERFGHQVSVESLLHQGTCHHLGVTDKTPLVPQFREEGHLTPSVLPAEATSRIEDVAGRAIRALGLTTGAVHTELILTDDGPVVLEVNGRIGGCVYGLMKYSRDYDFITAVAQTAAGIAPQLPGLLLRHAAFVRPQPPQGKFKVAAVDHQSVADALAAAQWGMLDKELGGSIDTGDGSSSNLARYVATATDVDTLLDAVDSINRRIQSAVTLEPVD